MEHENLLRDQLTGALIGLARAADGSEHLISYTTTRLIVEGLAALQTRRDEAVMEALLGRIKEEKRRMIPNCFSCASPCGRTSDYDMENLRTADPQIRQLKERILSAAGWVAVCFGTVAAQNCPDESTRKFLYRALFTVGMDDWGREALCSVAEQAEAIRARYSSLSW